MTRMRTYSQYLQLTTNNLQQKPELLELIQDEVNVKEVVFGKELKLDTTITPELREEGTVREFIRNLQEMRRDAGFQPKQAIRVMVSRSFVDERGSPAHGGVAGDRWMEAILEKWQATIKKEANAKELKIGGKKKFLIERDTEIDGQKVWIGLDKA